MTVLSIPENGHLRKVLFPCSIRCSFLEDQNALGRGHDGTGNQLISFLFHFVGRHFYFSSHVFCLGRIFHHHCFVHRIHLLYSRKFLGCIDNVSNLVDIYNLDYTKKRNSLTTYNFTDLCLRKICGNKRLSKPEFYSLIPRIKQCERKDDAVNTKYK